MSSPAAQAKPSYKRRTVVVKRGFQFKYAMIMFALFAVAAFMVWWEVFQSFRSLVARGLIQDPEAVRAVHDMGRMVLYKVVVALGIVWFLSLILSHFLAGPVFRLEACLQLLKSGDLVHRARLRTHDELKSLAANYNDSVESIQNRVRAIKEAVRGPDARAAIERVRAITDEFKV